MSEGPDRRESDGAIAEIAERILGRAVVDVVRIPAGLGARRFFRLGLASGEPSTVIARVEPIACEGAAPSIFDEPDLEPIRAHLERCGLPVPARYGADASAGIELLEDVGELSLEDLARRATDAERRALYTEAVDLVPRIQRTIRPVDREVAAFDRHLDDALIATKARKWLDWTIPAALGRRASRSEREATERAFRIVSDCCREAPSRLAHRDFKAANLILRSRRQPEDARGHTGRLVMIDLQGAFLAPPEYDLVCLLRDSHVLLDEDEIRMHCARVRIALPDAPPVDVFERRFDLITLARVAKDVSHYVNAYRERGDRRYLPLVSTALHNLVAAGARAAGRDPGVADFADLVSTLPIDFATSMGAEPPGDTSCAR